MQMTATSLRWFLAPRRESCGRARPFTVALAAALALIVPTCAELSVPSAAAQSTTASQLRKFFPYFAYITAGGAEDNRIAAEAWGIPVSQYIDAVCADLARHGFNVAWLNNIDYQVLPSWIGAAKRHGLKVIAQSGQALFPGAPATPSWSSIGRHQVDEVVSFYRRQARRYSGDRTLLMYVISEEPPASKRLFGWFRRAIRGIADVEPTHPSIVEYNGVDTVRLAARMLKPPIVVFGIGPFKHGDSDNDRRYFFPLITEQSYAAARRAGAPLWVLTQGDDSDVYEDGVFQKKAADRPTPAQLRWEVWSALLHGAKGIGYFLYSWQYPVTGRGQEEDLHGLVTRDGRATEIYEEAARMSRRLDAIKRLIVRLDAGRLLDDPNLSYWQKKGLVRSRIFVDRRAHQRYLLLVNYDFEAPRPFQLPDGLRDKSFTDLLSGRSWRGEPPADLALAPGDGTLLRVG